MWNMADGTRAAQVRERLNSGSGDALVLFPSSNMEYVTGFFEEPDERHLLLFVSQEQDPVYLIPELYETQIREATWVDDIRCWSDDTDPTEAVSRVIADLQLQDGHLLVDDQMWAVFSQDLRRAAPDASFGVASEVLAGLRMQKDEAELDALRRAGAVADDVVEQLRSMGESIVGMTETELATEITRLLEAHGGTGVSFEPIVGSGPNGAKPHHRHGSRKIQPGEPVVLDFGTRVDGYPSDQTRTIVFDKTPSETVSTVHSVVREALDAGISAIEPGVSSEEIDHATREIIESAGYGDAFVHRTGHGVGLDVHEQPYIVDGNQQPLKPGMVFSVEPGVYLTGEFGVRIEDLVAVTEDGCERLNHSPRGWDPFAG